MNYAIELLVSEQRMKRLYEKQFLQTCQTYEIGQRELDVLAFLANNPPFDTARDIVEKRMIAKSYVSISVENLIKKGLLKRSPDVKDRRIVHLSLTKQALPIISEIKLGQEKVINILFTGMSREQVSTFETLLGTIFQNIKTASET